MGIFFNQPALAPPHRNGMSQHEDFWVGPLSQEKTNFIFVSKKLYYTGGPLGWGWVEEGVLNCQVFSLEKC